MGFLGILCRGKIFLWSVMTCTTSRSRYQSQRRLLNMGLKTEILRDHLQIYQTLTETVLNGFFF